MCGEWILASGSILICLYTSNIVIYCYLGGCRGRDRMVVGFILCSYLPATDGSIFSWKVTFFSAVVVCWNWKCKIHTDNFWVLQDIKYMNTIKSEEKRKIERYISRHDIEFDNTWSPDSVNLWWLIIFFKDLWCISCFKEIYHESLWNNLLVCLYALKL